MTAAPAPVATPAASAPETAARSASLLGSAWSLDADSPRYVINLYRPNYLLPVRWSSRPNDAPFLSLFQQTQQGDEELNDIEARFQLSFKARILTDAERRWGLWFAYTQQSQWQVYNGDLSRPFRETNYEPELFATYRPDLSFAGFDWRLFALGYNHQSNGRADPVSRSWDRLVAQIGLERGDLALLLRAWYRLDDGGDDDDNPDITDYDWKQNAIGAGIALNDLLDRRF